MLVALPANLNPGYDVSTTDTIKEYIKGTSGEDLSAPLVKEIHKGEDNLEVTVSQNYQELQKYLGSIMKGIQG